MKMKVFCSVVRWGLASRITKMELKEFLSLDLMKLPKSQKHGDNFRQFLFELLNEYLRRAQEVNLPVGYEAKIYLEKLKILVRGINDTVKLYYSGKPFDAYRRLRNALKKSAIVEVWGEHEITNAYNFYRVRIKDSNYPLSREELFHIPFHLRGKVTTQRYSISGFPSLYLSNSIYVAWEELRRPNLEQMQVVRLMNKYQLKLIDLTTTRYVTNENTRESEELISDFLMWPLIAACSIKVKNPGDFFKPEYIVSQVLLQWIRNNTNYHGIKFSSTHIDLNLRKSIGDFFNLVIPVSDNNEVGFCKELSEIFNMTNVLSWQLDRFSAGAPGVISSYNVKDHVNENVKRVELIEGKNLPYEFSPFATLENALLGMALHDINFGS